VQDDSLSKSTHKVWRHALLDTLWLSLNCFQSVFDMERPFSSLSYLWNQLHLTCKLWYLWQTVENHEFFELLAKVGQYGNFNTSISYGIIL